MKQMTRDMNLSRPVAIFVSASVMASTVTYSSGTASAQDSFADHDSSLPVEIEADDLTVRQAENKAIFTGNVDAIQGTLVLNSDILTVYYLVGEQAQQSGQSVDRLEADGNVVITSPSETATGDEGVYDLSKGTMELLGNVVLTRGDNVIEGSRLDIDLNADTAVVQSGETNDGRVRALFQPGAQPQSASPTADEE